MTQLVLVGEALGEQEELLAHPFVGPSGQELFRELGDAGFPCERLSYNFISSYSMTRRWARLNIPLLNVFNERPADPEGKNRVEFFYGRSTEPVDKTLPVRKMGSANMYVLSKYAHHVHALRAKLIELKPNLIVALGNTTLWALGLPPAISTLRGSVAETPYGKCLPTYHPAAVLRQWNLRIHSVIDLMKARREMEYPEIRTLPRFILTEPSLRDLDDWWEQWGARAPLLALDIETARGQQVTEVSIAASPTQALHIPFFYENKGTFTNYWPSVQDEAAAWRFFKMVCESPLPKIGQNLIQYDAYFLCHTMGIQIRNIVEDTMIKSHAWQPELKKSLSFLGSVFLDERSWKHIRHDVAKEE
jgi:uracil-DNA glycosylase